MPWLTPDEIPEGTACRPLFIPDDSAWLAIVSGAILELTRSWNWEQFGTLTPDQCAERMQILQQQFYDEICNDCTLPAGGRVIRINFDGHFEELVGDAWVEPQGDYAVPPVTERTGGTVYEQTCLAAANAENVLAQLYEQTTDLFEEGLTVAELALELAVLLGLLIAPPLGLLGASVITLGRIAFAEFFAFMDFLTEDFWDAEFSEAIRCILLNCATNTDGVVTFDLDCVNLGIGDITNPFDLTGAQVRLLGQVSYLLSIIGVDGLNLAGTTTAITTPNCNCEWCAIIPLETTDGGFVRQAGGGQPWLSGGQWSSGQGWLGGIRGDSSFANNRYGASNFERTFSAMVITYVGVKYAKTAGQCSIAGACYGSQLADQSGVFYSDNNTTNDPDTTFFSWAGSRSMTALKIANNFAFCNNSCGITGSVTNKWIELRGVGEYKLDPAWLVDCP